MRMFRNTPEVSPTLQGYSVISADGKLVGEVARVSRDKLKVRAKPHGFYWLSKTLTIDANEIDTVEANSIHLREDERRGKWSYWVEWEEAYEGRYFML